jgi:hypothetical protein
MRFLRLISDPDRRAIACAEAIRSAFTHSLAFIGALVAGTSLFFVTDGDFESRFAVFDFGDFVHPGVGAVPGLARGVLRAPAFGINRHKLMEQPVALGFYGAFVKIPLGIDIRENDRAFLGIPRIKAIDVGRSFAVNGSPAGKTAALRPDPAPGNLCSPESRSTADWPDQSPIAM